MWPLWESVVGLLENVMCALEMVLQHQWSDVLVGTERGSVTSLPGPTPKYLAWIRRHFPGATLGGSSSCPPEGKPRPWNEAA